MNCVNVLVCLHAAKFESLLYADSSLSISSVYTKYRIVKRKITPRSSLKNWSDENKSTVAWNFWFSRDNFKWFPSPVLTREAVQNLITSAGRPFWFLTKKQDLDIDSNFLVIGWLSQKVREYIFYHLKKLIVCRNCF